MNPLDIFWATFWANFISTVLATTIGIAIVTPMIKLLERLTGWNVPEIGEKDEHNKG